MFSDKRTINMPIEDLENFAKQAKMTLEVLNEMLLGLQSRLEYNGHLVNKSDLVDMTYSVTFLIKGVLDEGVEIPLS